MRVSDDFILRSIAGEHLLIPTGEASLQVKGLIALSESGLLLYKKLKGGCEKPDLIAGLLAEYEVTAKEAEADTDAFLDQLRQLNMLVEE